MRELETSGVVPGVAEAGTDEQMVSVRRTVLSDVEHAVGNLLQRMHHAVRVVKGGSASVKDGERLEGALGDLERLLELLFDYVSPVTMEARPTEAGRVVESLAVQVRAVGGVEVGRVTSPGVRVLADPRVLQRAFLLLGRAFGRSWANGARVGAELACDPAGDRVRFLVEASPEAPVGGTAQDGLALAVAARLIELQGGELFVRRQPALVCAVLLPLVE